MLGNEDWNLGLKSKSGVFFFQILNVTWWVAGAKAKRVKVVKGDFIPVANVGASQNKILADISNLPQQPKQHIFVDHHLGVYRLYLET